MAKIFESPDGGHTVYKRPVGKTHREIVSESPEAQLKRQMLDEQKAWRDILVIAKSDPILQEMISKVKVYYSLKYND